MKGLDRLVALYLSRAVLYGGLVSIKLIL